MKPGQISKLATSTRLSHPDSGMRQKIHKPLIAEETKPNRKYKFRCEQCDRSFTRAAILKDHRRAHIGQKEYVCHLCPRVFVRARHMLRHAKTHRQRALDMMDHGPMLKTAEKRNEPDTVPRSTKYPTILKILPNDYIGPLMPPDHARVIVGTIVQDSVELYNSTPRRPVSSLAGMNALQRRNWENQHAEAGGTNWDSAEVEVQRTRITADQRARMKLNDSGRLTAPLENLGKDAVREGIVTAEYESSEQRDEAAGRQRTEYKMKLARQAQKRMRESKVRDTRERSAVHGLMSDLDSGEPSREVPRHSGNLSVKYTISQDRSDDREQSLLLCALKMDRSEMFERAKALRTGRSG